MITRRPTSYSWYFSSLILAYNYILYDVTLSNMLSPQTHDRPEYLKILLDSMRKVKDIQKSLLIISHDVYSHTLNEIVETVDFCPVSSNLQ